MAEEAGREEETWKRTEEGVQPWRRGEPWRRGGRVESCKHADFDDMFEHF